LDHFDQAIVAAEALGKIKEVKKCGFGELGPPGFGATTICHIP